MWVPEVPAVADCILANITPTSGLESALVVELLASPQTPILRSNEEAWSNIGEALHYTLELRGTHRRPPVTTEAGYVAGALILLFALDNVGLVEEEVAASCTVVVAWSARGCGLAIRKQVAGATEELLPRLHPGNTGARDLLRLMPRWLQEESPAVRHALLEEASSAILSFCRPVGFTSTWISWMKRDH
jgi:hypothetical protein